MQLLKITESTIDPSIFKSSKLTMILSFLKIQYIY